MNFIQVTYFGQTVWLPADPKRTLFYANLTNGVEEPGTFETLARYLNKDTVYIDIGGWIGVMAFWAEKLARKVIVVEPDPVCYALLAAGKAKNASSAELINAALSADPVVSLNAVRGFGSAESSLLPLPDRKGCASVPGIRFRDILAKADGAPCCIKIDVEGYEYFLNEELAALSGDNIRCVRVSLHPALLRKTLPGNRYRKSLQTALRTWRFRKAIPNHKLLMGFGDRLWFLYYCFRKIMLKRKGPLGMDLVFVRTSYTNT